MGRHSRRGPAPKGETADPPAARAARPQTGTTSEAAARRRPPGGPQSATPPVPPAHGTPARGVPRLPEGWVPQGPGSVPGQGGPSAGQYRGGAQPGGGPRLPDGTPAHGFPHLPDGTPAHGFPRLQDGTPAHGFPRLPDGTPAHGFPRLPDGTPAHGFPRLQDGTPAHGFQRSPGGSPGGGPAQGAPLDADGTPAHGVPRVRGGHPEQREAGGGWGTARTAAGSGYGVGVTQASPQGPPRGPGQGTPRDRPGVPIPGQRYAPGTAGAGGPRQAYVDAFDGGGGSGAGGEDDRFAPRAATPAGAALRADPFAPVTDPDEEAEHRTSSPRGPRTPDTRPDKTKGGKGRAFTGIAAAAVTTVLAVVVAGQVADGGKEDSAGSQATGADREAKDSASRTDKRPAPSTSPRAVTTLSYAQQMAAKYPLEAELKGGGKFDAVTGFDKAPGTGQKFTYRVDVEKSLGLDGKLFAQAVQKTLNDKRSWAHGGGRTFERISSGKPDFVITLASPGTTAFWCAKSGLDTTEDNVSCDSAATDRVMINAYRWAQGSETYGDKMYSYRQMLINHEVGHRLGYGHVSCSVDGGLAPVMQQQTKFLNHDGIKCRPNPWPFPSS
ncbi:DUF3152 domain-containing protein [Streptomyces sp. NPDC047070]|uniref:DUF3152 domain-containing protein n=1 Tax=Streptomyces sp. NPDC047070 TaxID=3154923 RepID=UPI003454AA9D